MERSEVEMKVKEVIAKILKMNSDEIGSEANFVFDLGADSQQSVELMAGFNEAFDIEMDEEKALGVQSVSDAVAFISTYLK